MKPPKVTTIPGDTDEKKRIRSASKVHAAKRIEYLFSDSNIKDNTSNFPKFDLNEVTLGKILGTGGFGTVYEVRGFEAGKTAKAATQVDDEELGPGGMESRQFIADHCIRKGGDSRYALKILSPDTIADPGTFLQGIVDMAVETRILSDVEHPNIIRMRACAIGSPFEETYFLVMDRLYDTMGGRMESWASMNKKLSGMAGRMLDRKGTKKKELMEQKLVAAFDMCAAIGHLHSKKIIYRDLKPDNVGFDIRDDVKIFDMGLAKEITNSHKPDKYGLYKLTSMTGSPRYMAPEVANEETYSFSCDTYSFGIMFWQMYSDTVPFELFGMKAMKTRVWNGERKRPFVQEAWPVPIKSLMRRSWSHVIAERPNFDQIYTILKNECVRVRGGNADGLEHTRRRSTFVFRGPKGTRLSNTKGGSSGMKELQKLAGDD